MDNLNNVYSTTSWSPHGKLRNGMLAKSKLKSQQQCIEAPL